MARQWDYVIVGAGAAGCLLAERLTQDGRSSVLLLEAGGKGRSLGLGLPIGWTTVAYGKSFNWGFRTAPEQEVCGRRVRWPRGRVLGGSTAINGMIYVRGHPSDFDAWADAGAEGWDWRSVEPFFQRFENLSAQPKSGRLRIQQASPSLWGERFIAACEAAGIPRNDNYLSGDTLGAGYYYQNVFRGWRQSGKVAFLAPAMDRQNLTVCSDRLVDRCVISDGRVTGVLVRDKQNRQSPIEGRHVILAAGAIGSPTVLQRSGMGDAEHLQRCGIQPLIDRPAVGQNLQDHFGTLVATETTPEGTVWADVRPWRLPLQLGRYVTQRKGLLAMPSSDVCVFHESGLGRTGVPDIQIHFTPAAGMHDEVSGTSKMDPVPGVTAITYPMHPTSRGSVLITDADAGTVPEIQANYLTTEHDRQVLLSGIRTLRRIYDAPPMQAHRRAEIRPGADAQTDEALLKKAGQQGTTGYHPVGTCRMGSDEDAVVDSDLKVRGLSGLSVIDASVMPKLTSGNTMAATYMIAEYGADKLLRERDDPAR